MNTRIAFLSSRLLLGFALGVLLALFMKPLHARIDAQTTNIEPLAQTQLAYYRGRGWYRGSGWGWGRGGYGYPRYRGYYWSNWPRQRALCERRCVYDRFGRVVRCQRSCF